jgi:hypothetical protein
VSTSPIPHDPRWVAAPQKKRFIIIIIVFRTITLQLLLLLLLYTMESTQELAI